MFANHMASMTDLYRKQKELQNLSSKRAKGKRTDISPKVIQMVSKYMKRYLTSLVMRKGRLKP